MIHATKAAIDTEKATLIQRLTIANDEKTILTQRLMDTLAQITRFQHDCWK